jgi:hypothetical protein
MVIAAENDETRPGRIDWRFWGGRGHRACAENQSGGSDGPAFSSSLRISEGRHPLRIVARGATEAEYGAIGEIILRAFAAGNGVWRLEGVD